MPHKWESRRLLLSFGLLVYWSALFVGTHVPPRSLSQPDYSSYDKVLHLSAYAGLAVLVFCALRSHRVTVKSCIGIVAFGLPLAAAVDEITQIPVPGRVGDPYDWLADVAGIGLGLSICLMLLFGLRSRLKLASSEPSVA